MESHLSLDMFKTLSEPKIWVLKLSELESGVMPSVCFPCYNSCCFYISFQTWLMWQHFRDQSEPSKSEAVAFRMPHQAHQPPLPHACDERREGFTICCTCYRTSKQGSPIRSGIRLGIAGALADCSQRWDGYSMHKMETKVIAIALLPLHFQKFSCWCLFVSLISIVCKLTHQECMLSFFVRSQTV